jgi:hypothetical protein
VVGLAFGSFVSIQTLAHEENAFSGRRCTPSTKQLATTEIVHGQLHAWTLAINRNMKQWRKISRITDLLPMTVC